MAVRRVDHEHIHIRLHQGSSALKIGLAHANSGGHAQASFFVLIGVGELLRLLDIGDSDQADAMATGIGDQQLLDTVLVQQSLGLLEIRALVDGDEIFVCHQLTHRHVRIRGEAHVAIGNNTD